MTARRMQGWASWAIATLAGATVVAGLAIGGGPIEARKERRDDARIEDLRRLAGHIVCLVDESGTSRIPADLSLTPGCPDTVPLTDSHSGAPYRVEPLEAGKFRLCAAFELPPEDQRWIEDRRNGDCIVEELPRRLRDGSEPPSDIEG